MRAAFPSSVGDAVCTEAPGRVLHRDRSSLGVDVASGPCGHPGRMV